MAASSIDFTKVSETLDLAEVQKNIDVRAFVVGNSAIANATADAIGPNSHSETLTQTLAVEHVGSSSASESVSATNGFHFFLG
ncbi:MAG: hypothetical protein ACXWLB_01600 [Reyranella sp.]